MARGFNERGWTVAQLKEALDERREQHDEAHALLTSDVVADDTSLYKFAFAQWRELGDEIRDLDAILAGTADDVLRGRIRDLEVERDALQAQLNNALAALAVHGVTDV